MKSRPESYGLLAIRILFFFLAAMVVNRFVVENRRQITRYQELAETLAETNRKLEQAQEEARRSERLAALGQMSAGLAHEIRNPLGVIKGSAEMLHQKLGESNPLASELAGYISSETNRLSALVTRFLDFARPLHAELTATGNYRSAGTRAARRVFVSTRKAKTSVRVERQYEPKLPPVPLDESLCEQAFVNLIQNAYDAMGSDGGTLQVTAARGKERQPGWSGSADRRHGAGNSAGIARADFQSVCHHQENGRGTWACRLSRGSLTGIMERFESKMAAGRSAGSLFRNLFSRERRSVPPRKHLRRVALRQLR